MMAIKSGTSSFIGLEPLHRQTSPSAQHLKRPWQSHWPPELKSTLDLWLNSEHPEVLTWKFDPETPFDRPWRIWTRSPRAEAEQPPVKDTMSHTFSELPQDHRRDDNDQQSIEAHRRPGLNMSVIDVDFGLKTLQLNRVEPESFKYLAPLALYHSEKPYLSRLPSLEGLKRTNIVGEDYKVGIFDVTTFEKDFALETAGFQFWKLPVETASWTHDFVRDKHIPLLTRWLKRHFSCTRVIIYAYNFRGEGQPSCSGEEPWKKPFFRVHCDATDTSCWRRLQLHVPDEVELAKIKRFRFVKVWRALSRPEHNCPLALCDFRSVKKDDLVRADIVFPHYCDEAYELFYNPAHRWFYKKGMSIDDIILFKLYDTSSKEAKFCPHSAFVDPTAPLNSPKRVSIEIRAIILD